MMIKAALGVLVVALSITAPLHGQRMRPFPEEMAETLARVEMDVPRERQEIIPRHFRTLIPMKPEVPAPTPRPGEPYGCRKVSACVCQTEDGSKVDLTPLGNTNNSPRFLDVADESNLYQYSWNPCYGFNEGTCSNVGLCQVVQTGLVKSRVSNTTVTGLGLGNLGNDNVSDVSNFDLGHQDTVDFDVSSQHGLMMVYTGVGDTKLALRTSYVQLKCDPNVEAEFTVQGEVQPAPSGIYYFTLKSRYACLSSPPTIPPTPVTPFSTPGVVTVTAGPGPNPIYSLKTIVDLLFALTVVAVVGVVVLLLVLTALCVKSRMTSKSSPTHLNAAQLPGNHPAHWTVQDKARLLP